MTVLEMHPLTISVPIYEGPPGVLRVGQGRVLLELVIEAYRNGESPQCIVEMYPALEPEEVFAVIAYYLANRPAVDEYLRQCDQQATAIQQTIEASQRASPSKAELLDRARMKGLSP